MLLKNLNLRVDDGVRLIDDFLSSTEFARKTEKRYQHLFSVLIPIFNII